jgi:homoserine dehydrogenase
VRVCVVGFGTVGRWVVEALARREDELRDAHGVELNIVGVANARDGFVYREGGLDPGALLELAASGAPITDHPGASSWPTAAAGLRDADFDLLIETTASPAAGGEPGVTHMRDALLRGAGVVTSNKWPVALAGVELVQLAREHGVPFRAEATVMSGTPVLGPLTEGLAGTTPRAVRGVLNATVNSILTDIGNGASYEKALAAAQAAGLAEPDPSADVDGHDSVAKLMILSALVFGRQLERGDVSSRGISALTDEELAAARSGEAGVLREVAELRVLDGGGAEATVAPRLLDLADPLAEVSGRMNAIVCEADPLGEIRIAGPGAGPELAGQGCLSDLIAVARHTR